MSEKPNIPAPTGAELEDVVRCAIQGTVDGAGIENLTARDLARVAIETIREYEETDEPH